jgi:hypothetical protein
MASYGYGPPPPAPPAAQAASTPYTGYPQPYHHAPNHGSSPGGRGGRGGHPAQGRGDYQGTAYQYATQSSAYASHGGYQASHPPQASYPTQHWQHDATHVHPPQPQPAAAPLPAQNYHPNYAPQLYQQQSFAQPPSYSHPAPHGPYGQQYAPAPQPNANPPQAWAGHAPSHHASHYSQGRGRGGHHNGDRVGPKAQMMGPPIRLGFDGSPSRDHSAPVSNGYSPQAYVPPQGGPGAYASAPFSYPAPGPPNSAGPAPYDSYTPPSSHGHGRGGFSGGSFRGRAQYGGDKTRHKKPGGHPPNANPHHHQKPDAASAGKKKKRKTNTLGLTPGDESGEDDADEETKLLELIGPDAPK